MGHVDVEAVVEATVEEASKQPLGLLLQFPQAHVEDGGERLGCWLLGDGRALVWGVCDTDSESTDVVGLALVTEADARLLQERHWRKQVDLQWYYGLNLQSGAENDFVREDILN